MAGGAVDLAFPAAARFVHSTRLLTPLGLAAILAAVTLYGPGLLYPSASALPPAAGAAAVILAGLTAPGNAVARVLSLRLIVAIGLVSYGWHLWHWPLLAFARIAAFGDLQLGSALAAGLLSLLMVVATYLAVERPARAWRRGLARRQQGRVILAGLLASGLCAGLGLGFSDLAAPRIAAALPQGLRPPPLEDDIAAGDPCALVGHGLRLGAGCLAAPAGT